MVSRSRTRVFSFVGTFVGMTGAVLVAACSPDLRGLETDFQQPASGAVDGGGVGGAGPTGTGGARAAGMGGTGPTGSGGMIGAGGAAAMGSGGAMGVGDAAAMGTGGAGTTGMGGATVMGSGGADGMGTGGASAMGMGGAGAIGMGGAGAMGTGGAGAMGTGGATAMGTGGATAMGSGGASASGTDAAIAGGAGGGPATGGVGGMAVDAPVNWLTASPRSGSLGAVTLGQTSTPAFEILVTNTGAQTTGFPIVAMTGANRDELRLSSNGCTAALPPGATCRIFVVLRGTSLGDKAADLTITASPGGVVTVPLSGAVYEAEVTLDPPSHDFGNVPLGQSRSIGFTVTNAGKAPIAGLTYALTANTRFSLKGSCPAALAPGESCPSLTVTFTALSAAAVSDQLVVRVPASGTTVATAPLAGGGAGPHLQVTPTQTSVRTALGTTSAPIPFLVTNVGNGPGTVTTSLRESPAVAVQRFKVSADGCNGTTLDAGKTCQISLTYTPTNRSSVQGVLQASSNGTSVQARVTGTP